jgi:hypothetical protein
VAKRNPLGTSNPHQKELAKLLSDMARAGGHRMWSLFRDFLNVHALALSNVADPAQREKREVEYMAIAKRYTKDELLQFRDGLHLVVAGLEENPFQDFLGSLFMSLELGNEWGGQFFTPYEVSYLMAKITFDAVHVRRQVGENGFVTIGDPCAGGGAMLIAAANAISDAGFNYQKVMHVTAQDIDLTAVHMTYIQLSLLYVPALVIHGNSLLVEERSHWFTLAHTRDGWDYRLALAAREPKVAPREEESESEWVAVEDDSADALVEAQAMPREGAR